MNVGDGFLNVSRSLDAHVAQLGAVFAGAPARPNRPFVEAFIRPRGAAVPATPVFVEALEHMVAVPPPSAQPVPAWVLALRPVVWALELAGRVPVLERIYWNPVKRREWAHNVEAIGHKNVERRAKRRDKASRVARKVGQQIVVRAKTAVKQALGAAGLIRHS